MGTFFTRERFGRPQVLAACLLLIFMGQWAWLVKQGASKAESAQGLESRLVYGLRQWSGGGIAGTAMHARGDPPEMEPNGGYDPNHSPLWYLVSSAPLVIWPSQLQVSPERVQWLARTPYLVFGLLLGASLWYVARRLYGNAGGYIALTLYCFSPGILRACTLWNAEPEIGAAWGAFGAIFTAIAVAHTLYAPREVVIWNWRRILLLGISLALAIGSQFSLVIVLPLSLGFMLYLAPGRRAAALAIWLSGCFVGFTLLFASYAFHPGVFWQGLRHANFLGVYGQAYRMAGAYQGMIGHLGQISPALWVAVPVVLAIFLLWKRARYFGNAAPLLVAATFLILAVGSPHYPGLGFQLMAVPFLFVFVAGVCADLLETSYGSLALACISGLLLANALWNVWELARVAKG